MNLRELKGCIQGVVLPTSPRTLGEREMASVKGGGPTINPGDDEPIEMTPSHCPVSGCIVADDCQD